MTMQRIRGTTLDKCSERILSMHTYTYQLPLTKASTKAIHIFNATNEPIYTMKRTYKTIFHQLFDSWIGEFKLICEYEGRNQNGTRETA